MANPAPEIQLIQLCKGLEEDYFDRVLYQEEQSSKEIRNDLLSQNIQ